MGGRVGISGAPGVGTTVRLVVPQAMAVTTILVVELCDERFGVPIEVIAEMTRVKRAGVLPIRSGAAFVLRDRTVPLLRLADLLGRPPAEPAAHANVLVVTPGGQGAGGHRVGIEVDRFGARMDVVLRPLGGLLAGMPGLRGASLLGDGRVLLVLDLPELMG
jgi:two-component system, chemotaxis family, sensor kinase CheA